MSRTAYVNGRFLPLREGAIRVEDRGFQFADGVYEVWAVSNGRLRDEAGHFARLRRSLAALSIAAPMSHAALACAIAETVRRNRVREGLVYLQITRGAAGRDHAFPAPAVRPTLVITAKAMRLAGPSAVKIVTTPEIRWARCDIKSIGLLANVLAKEEARQAGAQEAWFVDPAGFVTEGAASNAWIVTQDGRLITRALSAAILPGVTRAIILEIARSMQIAVEERAFTVAEALEAKEAFITSATRAATPVVAINGQTIGDGAPGALTLRLRGDYLRRDIASP